MLEKVRDHSYSLELPLDIDGNHEVLHVRYLKKFLAKYPTILPLYELRFNESKRLVGEPVAILERDTKQLRKERMNIVKVLWKKTMEVI